MRGAASVRAPLSALTPHCPRSPRFYLHHKDADASAHSPSYAQPDLLTYFGDPPPEPNPVPQPFPTDPIARAALDQLEPFQVFSCWNGAVVMPARAFTHGRNGEEGDARGTGRGPLRFRTAKNDASAVTERQSECFLVPVDLWKRGMGRVMVVPRARCVLSVQSSTPSLRFLPYIVRSSAEISPFLFAYCIALTTHLLPLPAFLLSLSF